MNEIRHHLTDALVGQADDRQTLAERLEPDRPTSVPETGEDKDIGPGHLLHSLLVSQPTQPGAVVVHPEAPR